MLTEREFTRQIRELAQLFGWLRYHTWLSQHSAAGFPDEVLVRPPRIVFAELKSETGKPSPAQIEWLDRLASIPTLEVCLWRPNMIDAIALYLQRDYPPEIRPGSWQQLRASDAMRASDHGAWAES